MNISLSVVMPMYNEEECVRATLARITEALMSVTETFEIIVVDDASIDGCGAIADAIAAADQRIRVVHHPANRKLGGSLRTGFSLARNEYVLYTDMDMPFDFSEIAAACRLARAKDADLVTAFRVNRAADGLRRYVYSCVFNSYMKLLLGVPVRDINFSFKLIRTALLRELGLRSEGSFINTELITKIVRRKGRIVQFGTVYFPRRKGLSTLSSPGVIVKIISESLAFRFKGGVFSVHERI